MKKGVLYQIKQVNDIC